MSDSTSDQWWWLSFQRQAPTVREVDGLLVVDWPEPRPTSFEISAEAFQALINRANRGATT